jgi:hypothetical protein
VVPACYGALRFLREPEDFRACMNVALRAGGDAESVA